MISTLLKPPIFLLAVSSSLIGLFASLLGIGGGFVLTPYLIDFQGLNKNSALALSATFGFQVALVSLIVRLRKPALKELISFSVALKFGIPCGVFSLLGATLASYTPLNVIRLLFVGLISWILLQSLLTKNSIDTKPKSIVSVNLSAVFLSPVFGLLAGLLAIGGGVFFLPYFFSSLRIPIKNAAATSGLAVLLTSTGGFIGHYPNLFKTESPIIVSCLLGGLLGSILGGKVIAYIPAQVLKYLTIFLQLSVILIHITKLLQDL